MCNPFRVGSFGGLKPRVREQSLATLGYGVYPLRGTAVESDSDAGNGARDADAVHKFAQRAVKSRIRSTKTQRVSACRWGLRFMHCLRFVGCITVTAIFPLPAVLRASESPW